MFGLPPHCHRHHDIRLDQQPQRLNTRPGAISFQHACRASKTDGLTRVTPAKICLRFCLSVCMLVCLIPFFPSFSAIRVSVDMHVCGSRQINFHVSILLSVSVCLSSFVVCTNIVLTAPHTFPILCTDSQFGTHRPQHVFTRQIAEIHCEERQQRSNQATRLVPFVIPRLALVKSTY